MDIVLSRPHRHSTWLRSADAWPPQDNTIYTLNDLFAQNYDQVTWETSSGATDYPCTSLDRQTWDLADFISGTQYGASIFSRSHVGCRCSILVSSSTDPTLEVIRITAY